MSNLIFYTHPMSRGRIIRWMLEETGLPYQTEIITYGEAMKSPEYSAVNPMNKVPALRHGKTIVTETAAICTYLADTFPEKNLAPPADQRGDYYRWLFFAAGPLEQALIARALGWEVPDKHASMVGFGSYTATVNALETAVAGRPFITGDRFSAADVYVGAQIGWGLMFGTLEKRPAFESYWQSLSRRPAFIKAEAIDNALLEKYPVPMPTL